jgi:exopolyphosphatase/guanosine-5'-triphosphate,3'-diphosphate pyrophosphatase
MWRPRCGGCASFLRLAVVLNRARSRQPLPIPQLAVAEQRLELRFPAGWLDAHPLTRTDLTEEARFLRKAGFRLDFA